MTTTAYDQVLTLVYQLTAQEQARLIAVLADALAAHASTPPAVSAVPDQEAWVRLFACSDDIRATYPDAHPAARLEEDRRERDAMLREGRGATDVHA